jgi:hypothetical protein
MRSHLQVKVGSLADEMKRIHRLEIKWKARGKAARQRQKQQADEKTANSILYAEKNFWSLRLHRKDLKFEARTSHLAYGFMRGRAYSEMEYIAYGKERGRIPPDWDDIAAMVERFTKDETSDQRDVQQKFAEWLAAAKAWYDGNPDRIEVVKGVRKDMANARIADAEYQAKREAQSRFAREAGIAAAQSA